MKRRAIGVIAVLLTGMILATLSGCARQGGTDPNTVYEDMQAAFEQAGLLSANIGLFTKTEENGSVTYHNGGSGVIFQKDGPFYYALTSAHVVDAEGDQFLVYTVNTEMKMEEIPGLEDMNVPAQETYDAMYTAEVLYKSIRDDLAVIRFAADEDLVIIEIADAEPEKGDRILCVGNPENEWFTVTYGNITSGLKEFGTTTSHPSNAMEHSAYMYSGSSGGAAIGEQMKLVGITPGIVVALDGETFERGVLIPVSGIRLCLEEWENQ